jgi:hypothetical protein
MWTMQEIGLASSAKFFCGRFQIAWEHLFKAYELLNSESLSSFVQRMDFSPSRVISLRWTTTDRQQSVLELLELSRHRGATDPRDRIFALMSHPAAKIARFDNTSSAIFEKPNYTMSVDFIYITLAKRLIQETRCLDVLSFAGSQSFADYSATPSWAPRWEERRDISDIVSRIRGSTESWFGYTDAQFGKPFSPQFMQRHIFHPVHIKGVKVGIVHRSPIPLSVSSFEVYCHSKETGLSDMWEAVQRNVSIISKGELYRLFIEAVTGGQFSCLSISNGTTRIISSFCAEDGMLSPSFCKRRGRLVAVAEYSARRMVSLA